MARSREERTISKQERQTNLVLALLNATQPLALSRIRDEVPGYDGSPVAVRQRFERDKRELRYGGVEVQSVPLDNEDQVGYRIEPSSLFLADLELDDDESRALGLAAATLGFGGDGVARVLLDSPSALPAGAQRALPALPYLYRALGSASAVRFEHKGRTRHVAVGALIRHAGRWYVGGLDLDRGEPRHFRVDRIEGIPQLESPGSGVLSDAQIEGLRRARPWEHAPERNVTVCVDASIAGSVLRSLGEPDSRKDAGPVEIQIGWALPVLARNWVLALGEHAEVVAPKRHRDEISEWLRGIAKAPRSEAGGVRWREKGAEQGQLSAAQRLLAVLTTLSQLKRTTLTGLAMRFGMEREQMRTLLLEAACMGVPPFLHGDLLDIQVPIDEEDGDEVVWTDSPIYTPRLTWRDAFELSSAARAALSITGAAEGSAMARALEKIERASGAAVEVDLPVPDALSIVETAIVERRQLLVTYYSASSDTLADRRIEPAIVREHDGLLYVLAWCHLAKDWRTFRIDRIDAASDVGPREHPGAPPPFDDVFGFADAERVEIALDPSAQWVLETEAVEAVGDLDDGRVAVRLRVASIGFLERLLLQAGPGAQVLTPSSLEDAGRDAAKRLLRRYRS